MISETAERDFQAVKALLQQEKLKEVYEAYEPVLRDMLSVFSEAEWFEFWKQNGELEEQPLRLHLAAWKGDCLEIGCYEEDVTEKLADFLQKKLPEKAFNELKCLPVNVDADEEGGDLEPQLEPYRKQVKAWGFDLGVCFDDTYCSGLYFVFLEKTYPQ